MAHKYDEDGNLIEEVAKEVEETESEETGDDDGQKPDDSKKTVSLSKYLKLKKELKNKEEGGTLSDEDRELLQSVRQDKATKELKTAYDGEFEKLTKMYPQLKDKSAALFQLAQVSGNEDKTLEDIALDTFGGFIQKGSSDDDGGSGAGGGNADISNVDFDNMSADQSAAVMKDPAAKKKYYAHLDTM